MSIVEYTQTEAALATLREKHAGPFEVATTAGMKQAKEARAEVRGYRVALEAKRVEIKAPALDRCREIDAEAKRITAELLAIEEPIDSVIKSEEARKAEEKARVEAEARARAHRAQRTCNAMRAAVASFSMSPSADIEEAIQSLGNEVFPDDEHRAEVAQVRMETLAALCNLQAGALAREAESKRMADERAELERQKAEAARVAKEESDRIEAAAKAERARLAAEAEAMRAKIAAEEAQAKAKRDEADRVAHVERDRLEAEARAARAAQDRIAAELRAADEKRLRAEREELEAEQAKQRKERAEAEAIAQAKRDEIAAQARAVEAERMKRLSAHALLAEFVRVYGNLSEFAGVVAAIHEATERSAIVNAEWDEPTSEAAHG